MGPVFSTVLWKSSDISTATVDEFGTVIGLKPGIVTITATSAVDSNVKGTYELTIEPPLLNLEWKISDVSISIVLKDLLSTLEELQPSVMPAKGTASVNGGKLLLKTRSVTNTPFPLVLLKIFRN